MCKCSLISVYYSWDKLRKHLLSREDQIFAAKFLVLNHIKLGVSYVKIVTYYVPEII